MTDHEKDLARASEYLRKKDASVEQLVELAKKLRGHATELEAAVDCCPTTRSTLRLQAAQLLNQAQRMQSGLLDDVQCASGALNDRRLADALDAAPSSLSRIRSAHLCIGATLIVRIHELTNWPIRDIKSRLNLPCRTSLASLEAKHGGRT